MILTKLCEDNIDSIGGKRIYIVEKSVSYLNELFARFNVNPGQIEFIADDYERNQGSFDFAGTKLLVKNMSELSNVDKDAVIIITSDYYREAFDRINAMKIFVEDKVVYYFANRETEIEDTYREKYADSALENIVVFRSGPHPSQYLYGCDFADNARALFEYMLLNGYTKEYELVWIVKDPEAMSRYFLKCYEGRMNEARKQGYVVDEDKVKFISYEWSVTDDIEKRDEYYRVLCRAKSLFCTDAYGFMRNCRDDQVRVQLWHGCGFKTRTNFVSCEHRYDYNIVIGKKYKEIHAKIYGLRDDQVVITGYAKQDWVFCKDWKEKYVQLGIPTDKRVIFWMPTFRSAAANMSNLNEGELHSSLGLPIVEDINQLSKVNELLAQSDSVMVIKLHPFHDSSKMNIEEMSNIVVLNNDEMFDAGVQINELLAGADAMISDYSSAAIDFLMLDRPIGFLLEDVEAYSNSRGFVFENIRDWLPGREIYDFDGYMNYLDEIVRGVDKDKTRRSDIRSKLFDVYDGNSCERIADKFVLGKKNSN